MVWHCHKRRLVSTLPSVPRSSLAEQTETRTDGRCSLTQAEIIIGRRRPKGAQCSPAQPRNGSDSSPLRLPARPFPCLDALALASPPWRNGPRVVSTGGRASLSSFCGGAGRRSDRLPWPLCRVVDRVDTLGLASARGTPGPRHCDRACVWQCRKRQQQQQPPRTLAY